MQERSKRFRFTLGSLFLLPLLISPLLLSRMVIRDALNPIDTVRGAYTFLNVLAVTTIYAAIFTGCSRQHRSPQWPMSRNVLPAAWKGSGFGILFMAQIAIPLLIALALKERGAGLPSLIPLVASGGIMLALGAMLGAFGGIVIGIAREWRLSRSDGPLSKEPPI